MKEFNITIVREDGLYSHTNSLHAKNKKEALEKVLKDKFRDVEKIVSITVIENKKISDEELERVFK